MLDLFSDLNTWHWLSLGLVLLIAEALGVAGFLIGAAVAAFALATVTWLVPDLSVPFQLGLFAAAALLATWAYLQVFRGMADADTAGESLNRRAGQLVGSTLTLDSEVGADEEVRVQIGDTFWRVHATEALEAGAKVRIVGTSGDSMCLEVRTV